MLLAPLPKKKVVQNRLLFYIVRRDEYFVPIIEAPPHSIAFCKSSARDILLLKTYLIQ